MISGRIPTTCRHLPAAAIGLAAALVLARGAAAVDADPGTAAARRGVSYLIDRADEMPAPWRANVFSVLAKIATDVEQAETCRALAQSARAQPFAELPAHFEASLLRWPRTFREALSELLRRRELDLDWRGPARELAALLADHEDELWAPLSATQRLVVRSQLEQLGIETRLRESEIADKLRARWASEDHAVLLADAPFVLGITHLIFVRSGYFDRMVDPAPHAVEIEVLDRAAERYAQGIPETPIFLDIAGEILAARRLLGQPDSEATRELVANLVALQRPDGSWGEKRLQRDVHATLTLAEGLGAWPGKTGRAESAP